MRTNQQKKKKKKKKRNLKEASVDRNSVLLWNEHLRKECQKVRELKAKQFFF
jgi:hypothetical protein